MKTVIIHGKKLDGQNVSPRHGRSECDLWGVTRANCRFWKEALLDWTGWHDVHPLVATMGFPGIPERRPDAWDWYRKQDGTRPIYMMAPEDHPEGADRRLAAERFAMVPGARPFPIHEIQRRFPIVGGTYPNMRAEPNRWFVEMTGMMIAQAVMEGYECIILNGVGTMGREDFIATHLSMLYWVAAARHEGVIVLIEGKSFLKTPSKLYAYEKFNFDTLLQVRANEAGREHREGLSTQMNVNLALRRRGRPPKYKLPPEDALV